MSEINITCPLKHNSFSPDEAKLLKTTSGDSIQKTSQYIQGNKAFNMRKSEMTSSVGSVKHSKVPLNKYTIAHTCHIYPNSLRGHIH